MNFEEQPTGLALRRKVLLKCRWKEPEPDKEYNVLYGGSRTSINEKDFKYFLVMDGFVYQNDELPPVESCLTAWGQHVWPVLYAKGYRHISWGDSLPTIKEKYYGLLEQAKHDGLLKSFGLGDSPCQALCYATLEALR